MQLFELIGLNWLEWNRRTITRMLPCSIPTPLSRQANQRTAFESQGLPHHILHSASVQIQPSYPATSAVARLPSAQAHRGQSDQGAQVCR